MIRLLNGAVVAVFIALLSTYSQAGSPNSEAQKAIDGQIRAFLADKDAEAYSFAAPNVRSFFPTVDSFIGMVKNGYLPVYRPQDWEFGRMKTIESGAVMQEVLITDLAGKNWAAIYTVQMQADGNWKITGVSLKKSEAITM